MSLTAKMPDVLQTSRIMANSIERENAFLNVCEEMNVNNSKFLTENTLKYRHLNRKTIEKKGLLKRFYLRLKKYTRQILFPSWLTYSMFCCLPMAISPL